VPQATWFVRCLQRRTRREREKFAHNIKLVHVSISTASVRQLGTTATSSTMRTSSRLEAQREYAALHERLESRQRDREKRGEPRECAIYGCSMAARHRGSRCESHFRDNELDRTALALIYQGCPQFLNQNQHRIKWSGFRPSIAWWIEQNLELWPPPPPRKSPHPEMVLVRGWKGSLGGLYESKGLDGRPMSTDPY
jgi:hypothetical protein